MITALFCIGALVPSAHVAGAPPAKRPNILIVTTDQQQVGAMSAVGNPLLKTPGMDSIAANGVCFTKSYCPYPLCSPSRSSLHTGRPPHEIRVDQNTVPIDPAIPISGQVFRAAGYDTGYAGKWHMPDPYPNDGIAGYEVLNKTTRLGKLAHDVDEATMNAAIEFLRREREKPFLLVTSFINPHDICLLAGEKGPLVEDVWKKYEPPAGAELPPLPPNFAVTAGGPDTPAKRRGHDAWDENQWRRYRYAYCRMVEDVDRQVGQVMDALRQAGREDDTLVIFTSDHGEGLGSHRWTGKMMYYEEEVAVPLVVSWKGITPAGRIDREHLVSTLDVLPTLCDYAGVQAPPSMRGESLRGIIENPKLPGHEFVAAEMAQGNAAGRPRSFMIRTPKFKYMIFPGVADASPAELLFNLDSDPGELTNIASEAASAAELDRHRRLLEQWKTTTCEKDFPPATSPAHPRKKGKRKGASAGAGATP